MKVLMVTGDRRFGPGHPRYELQKGAVEELALIYFGPGSLAPRTPPGHFDVVTAQDPFWRGLLAWRVARRMGAKLNVQVHADLVAQSVVKKLLARFVLARADSVRVVAEHMVAPVQALAPEARITTLPVFVDLERFRALPHQPHERKTILWIGRFEQEKDPFLALRVFKDVREKIDATLIMLGDGSLAEVLTSAAAGLPVEFPGWRDSALYLQTADAVLSTSRAESYGASMVEALAAGVPVVAPDVGVAKEAGAIVVPREELAQAVIRALKEGARGELILELLTREEWLTKWKESLA